MKNTKIFIWLAKTFFNFLKCFNLSDFNLRKSTTIIVTRKYSDTVLDIWIIIHYHKIIFVKTEIAHDISKMPQITDVRKMI